MTIDISKLLKDENAAWNQHNVDMIAAFYTEDCIKEDIAIGAATVGKEEMKALIRRAFIAIPDMKIELKTLFTSGTFAASEWVMSGTFLGEFSGFPPATGKSFSVRGATVMELRNGKISRIADYWNYASFLEQVGLPEGKSQT